MSSFRKVYDLREDARLSRRESGESPGPIRIDHAHGATGSAAWWDAITSGELAHHTIEGRIVRLFRSGLPSGDWSEFEMDTAGSRTRWSQCVSVGATDSPERREAIDMYQVGRPVRLRYVLQPVAPPLPGKEFVKTALEIWIGN